jgi:ABC-type multidrug transport system permease subunit
MSTEKNYEFDSAQNETMLTLGKSLQFLGAASLVLAMLFGVGVLGSLAQALWRDAFSQAMFLVFAFSMGTLMMKAGGEFQAIVVTAGSDISHLMSALEKLRRMFSILGTIVVLFILLTIVALAVALVYSVGPAIA